MHESVRQPDIPGSINDALKKLPEHLLSSSGSVFYTGKQAFQRPSAVYLLGLNPGGDPLAQCQNTVAKHIAEFRDRCDPWSAYVDEIWEGASPGSWGMQPRIQHLMRNLDLDPRLVPASNVVFARTRSESDLRTKKRELLDACWPVHSAVLAATNARVVLCLGKTCGLWVRERLNAHQHLDQFREANGRGWTSDAYASPNDQVVVTLTHPSRAEWRNPAADPTPLVVKALGFVS